MEEDLIEWPFPIPPEEKWTRQDRERIEFFQTARAEGFGPRTNQIGTFILARSVGGREIAMIHRGRGNGWEMLPYYSEKQLRLSEYFHLAASSCVCMRPPFRNAGYFALEWLRGRDFVELLKEFRFVGGYPAGITRQAISESPGTNRSS